MVECGPYIEYCCRVYVRQDYVIFCVVVCWLAIFAVDVIWDAIQYLIARCKKKEP